MSVKPREAAIVIEGVTLTSAQSMTLRVALASFASELNADGLGSDEAGRAIADGYRRCIADLQRIWVTR